MSARKGRTEQRRTGGGPHGAGLGHAARATAVAAVVAVAAVAGRAHPAAAQGEETIAAPGPLAACRGQRVDRVDVVGPSGPLEAAVPLGLAGGPCDRARVGAALTALLESGAYADVQVYVDPASRPFVVEFRVTPASRVVRIDVRGNEVLRDAEVREPLASVVGGDVVRADLPELEASVRAVYEARGYDRATATMRTVATDRLGEVVLLVEVDEGAPTRVLRARYVGDRPPPIPAVTRPLEQLEGEVLDRRALERTVEDCRAALRARGYLRSEVGEPSVAREGGRATVELPLRLGPHVTVQVVGAAPFPISEVVDALELGTANLDAAGLATLSERAADYFRRRGYPRARARVVVEHAGEGERTLLVDVDRRAPLRVMRYVFEGNDHFDESFLREQVESFLVDELDDAGFGEPVDAEVIDRLVGGRPESAPRERAETGYVAPEARYYPPVLERALAHVQALYHADGYVEASLSAPRLVRREGGTAEVVVQVVEGPRATYWDVTIAGNVALSDRTLASALDLERGRPYSDVGLRRAVDRLLDRYRDDGYLYATVEDRVAFSDDRTRAIVELEVQEGEPVTVGAVRIVGLRLTKESLVRSLVALREGEVFTRAAARRTEERLLDLGIFSSVVVSPNDAEVPEARKDVVVTVTERMPQVLDFGAGVSTGQGVRGSFEYVYRNLFGRAVTMNFRAQVSGQFFFVDPVLEARFATLSLEERLERRITFGITLPTAFGDPRFRTSFNALNLRDNAYKFGIDKSALDVTLAYRPSRNYLLSVSPTLERNVVGLLVRDETYDDVLSGITDPSLRQLLRVPEGSSTLVAFATQGVVDFRDNALSPTRGAYLSSQLEWARTLVSESVELGGEATRFFSHHLRLSLVGSTYLPLRERLTLAFQARYGRIIHLESRSETFPNRQFFLGGVDSMRAYRQDAMVPQDIIDELAREGEDGIPKTALVQGGDTYLLVRTELRFPMFGSVGGALFGEFGNLWADASNFEPWNLRPTAGFGLRLETPVGPIALDYGVNILSFGDDRQLVGERIGAFNFSIGVY